MSKWSQSLQNKKGKPFENLARGLLEEIYERQAGTEPFFAAELGHSMWALENEPAKKDVKTGRSGDRSPFHMDGFTIYGKDHQLIKKDNTIHQAVVNFEIETTAKINGAVESMAEKINLFSFLTDAHTARARSIQLGGLIRPRSYQSTGGTAMDIWKRIRTNTNTSSATRAPGVIDHSLFGEVDQQPMNLVIFITNFDEPKGTDVQFQRELLKGTRFGIAHPVLVPLTDNGTIVPGAFDVETPGNESIRIGQVCIDDLVDIAVTMEALNRTPAENLVLRHDRMLWRITAAAFGREHAFSMKATSALKLTHRQHIPHIKSKPVLIGRATFQVGPIGGRVPITSNIYSVRMTQDSLARFAGIHRTIQDTDELQRIPVNSHLRSMVQSIDMGKRFHQPVLLVADDSTNIVFRGRSQGLEPSAGGILQPYGLQTIDGQHRILSRYLRPGVTARNDHVLDVNIHKFPQGTAQGHVKEAIAEMFYDVNYRGMKPPAEIALVYMARRSELAYGWEIKGRGPGKSNTTWTGRVHAMRFLMELNETGSLFNDAFDIFATGVEYGDTGRKRLKVKSISDYISTLFEFSKKDSSAGRGRQLPFAKEVNTLWKNYSDNTKLRYDGMATLNFPQPGGSDYGIVTAAPPNINHQSHLGGPSVSDLEGAGFYKQLKDDFEFFCQNLFIVREHAAGGSTRNTRTRATTRKKDLVYGWCLEPEITSQFFPALFRVFVRFHCVSTPASSTATTGPFTPRLNANSDLHTPHGLADLKLIGQAIWDASMHIRRGSGWIAGGGGVDEIEKRIVEKYNAQGPHVQIPL